MGVLQDGAVRDKVRRAIHGPARDIGIPESGASSFCFFFFMIHMSLLI